MGNSSSSNSVWPPGKLFKREHRKKSSKKKKPKRTNSVNASPASPMYDTVADFPVYSVVDKSRKNNPKVEDNVQYADIEVIRKPTGQSQKKPALSPKPVETTEYATINFTPQINTASQQKGPTWNSPARQSKAFPPNNSAKHHKVPPPGNSASQYKASLKHASISPKKYNATNGTLV